MKPEPKDETGNLNALWTACLANDADFNERLTNAAKLVEDFIRKKEASFRGY
jgi:hypothetical protein